MNDKSHELFLKRIKERAKEYKLPMRHV